MLEPGAGPSERGLDFLFSRNRLNVAISRAKCLAYLVASSRLLDANCRTVEQMRLANAFCRFVELSGASGAVAGAAGDGADALASASEYEILTLDLV